jgi:dihydroneopterin aldolase
MNVEHRASDRIVLAGMAFEARHGVNDSEKAQAQRFEVDVELAVDAGPAGKTDDLARTVDYRDVYDVVRAVLEGPTVDLLETLAQSIAVDVLARSALVSEVVVRVRKPEVQLGGPLDYAGVEVVRRRGG